MCNCSVKVVQLTYLLTLTSLEKHTLWENARITTSALQMLNSKVHWSGVQYVNPTSMYLGIMNLYCMYHFPTL
jgi:hypothetical protein